MTRTTSGQGKRSQSRISPAVRRRLPHASITVRPGLDPVENDSLYYSCAHRGWSRSREICGACGQAAGGGYPPPHGIGSRTASRPVSDPVPYPRRGCSRPPRRSPDRLPPASLGRCDGPATEPFHLRTNTQRLMAHQGAGASTGPFGPAVTSRCPLVCRTYTATRRSRCQD
jgi:hypothetical protein